MSAVLRRELRAYLTSPIGYVFLAVFYFFAGVFFWASTLYGNTNSISGVFNSMYIILMIIVPVLTMQLFSEEKKMKTDQLLLTSPVSITGVVMGKFLSALLIFALGTAITLVFAFVVALFAQPSWVMLGINLLGMLLMGAAMIAIGIFVSALTESQIIAAVGGFALMMIFTLMDTFATMIPVQFISDFMKNLSFSSHYNNFVSGTFNFSDILFFLSFAAIFIFLTIRVIEKRRWS